MKKGLILSMLLWLGGTSAVYAVPAIPGIQTLEQPDGSEVSLYIKGDERMSYFETEDGLMVLRNNRGAFYYAMVSQTGEVVPSAFMVSKPSERDAATVSFINATSQSLLREKMIEKRDVLIQRAAPNPIVNQFPTTGDVRGLVILAQYNDVKFSEGVTNEAYTALMNEQNYKGGLSTGSVKDYFAAQSMSKLNVICDVAGPVTLSQDRAFYGTKNTSGLENVDAMVSEAVKLAKEQNPDLDFSKYDVDGDRYVDFVFVIYAGYGEAQGGPIESVWPQQGTLQYKDYTSYNGLRLSRYACSCELNGNKGTNLDGIGTFCHEFSHILGLPDIYDTLYSGAPGYGHWDIMDVGSYNDGSKTPSGYTAMDRYTLGWLEPELLESSQKNVTLENLGTSNKAYFLVNPELKNEYYILENRQQTGWDAALPGHGMIVSHVEYDQGVWNSNKVNTWGKEYVHLVRADNATGTDDEESDPFPGTWENTSLSDSTIPRLEWNSGKKTGIELENIVENDGVISFDFTTALTSVEKLDAEANANVFAGKGEIRIANNNAENISIYNVNGAVVYAGNETELKVDVAAGCYIVKVGTQTQKLIVR